MDADAYENVRERGIGAPMSAEERAKLYDWLANGKVDVWLRRLVCERIVELEDALSRADALLNRQIDADGWLGGYVDEALTEIRSALPRKESDAD